MPDKLTSEILKVDLDGATFKDTKESFEPTYVNYFFGANGTGKSTIAETIHSGQGVTYKPGKDHEDYITLVYNQAFIDANMRNYHNLGGVFTINEVNVEIQKQIDEKEKLLEAAGKTSSDAVTEQEKKEKIRSDLLKQLYKDCWDKTEDLRTAFDETQDGKKKSKQFTEEVRRHSSVQHDLEKLRLMCDSAYSSTAKRYSRFGTVSDTSVLDELEGKDILSVVIANAAQTELAKFLDEIGATEWFRTGHADYHEKADGKCPYCRRILPEGFEKTVTDSFDGRYEKNLAKLDAFLKLYEEQSDSLLASLSELPAEIYPAIDIKPYNDKLGTVKAVISANTAFIRQKQADPAKTVTLSETASLLKELSDIIDGFNKLIDDNNAIVAAEPKKKQECRDQVFEHMAFVLKDVLEAYDRSDATLEKEINAQKDIADKQKEIIDQLIADLKGLRSQTVENETAMTNINTMLKDAGFQGFEMRPRKEEIIKADGTVEVLDLRPASYEVVRTDTGLVAENLSEGEKNFIAFLYFQQKVFGSDTAEGDARQKIVVIDDPVSSMDSGALFIIGEQIRKMIEICRNNADSRRAAVKGNFIKQIFVLTHNAYFHREVTYLYANRYDFVSFYLVKKRENRSSVTLMRRRNPDCPTEWMNVNPVKNSYAALWEEYKELKDVTSPVPLLNVIRRILEYYFLQICGYDGSQLRKVVLEDNKAEYTHDENGNEDYTKFDI